MGHLPTRMLQKQLIVTAPNVPVLNGDCAQFDSDCCLEELRKKSNHICMFHSPEPDNWLDVRIDHLHKGMIDRKNT